MSAPCWYVDSKTLIIKGANAEAATLFGYSEDEFIGQNSIHLLAISDSSRLLEIRKGEKWGAVGSFTFVRKDGSMFIAGVRWHQTEYRGTLCDCMILVPSGTEATSIESECECDQTK